MRPIDDACFEAALDVRVEDKLEHLVGQVKSQLVAMSPSRGGGYDG
jgi:hypothetical protein